MARRTAPHGALGLVGALWQRARLHGVPRIQLLPVPAVVVAAGAVADGRGRHPLLNGRAADGRVHQANRHELARRTPGRLLPGHLIRKALAKVPAHGAEALEGARRPRARAVVGTAAGQLPRLLRIPLLVVRALRQDPRARLALQAPARLEQPDVVVRPRRCSLVRLVAAQRRKDRILHVGLPGAQPDLAKADVFKRGRGAVAASVAGGAHCVAKAGGPRRKDHPPRPAHGRIWRAGDGDGRRCVRVSLGA